jgi:hypothetical protein
MVTYVPSRRCDNAMPSQKGEMVARSLCERSDSVSRVQPHEEAAGRVRRAWVRCHSVLIDAASADECESRAPHRA